MSVSSLILTPSLSISSGISQTSPIQILNGSTQMTIQFLYSGLDANITLTLLQSLDGINFDHFYNPDSTPLNIILSQSLNSVTLNIPNLLTTWIQFFIDPGEATTGTIDKIHILMK